MVGTTIITPPFQAKKKPLKKFVASRKRTWNFKSGRTIQCYAFFTHKKFTIQCYEYYTHNKFTIQCYAYYYYTNKKIYLRL